MINVPVAFRQKLYRNERDYLLYADITLSDGTVLNLENDQIWNNGMSIEDAVSEDDSFTALGAAILGSSTLTINNMDESFSDYDFMNAKVVLRVGLELPNGSGGIRVEDVQKGVYTVDDTSYNGALIVLTMLDNMEQFDRPYNDPLGGSKLAYPASLGEIVRNACRNCGVTLLTQSFPHDDFIVQTRPIDDALTYREVLGWAASIAGCFARCDRYGRLELKWFDRATLDARDSGYDGGEFDEANPYATGDALDGGTFSPWSTGSAADGGEFTDERPIHHIYALYSQNISMDDVVITGVRILVENDDEDAEEQILPFTAGQLGYVIEISGNDFITKTNAQTVADWLGVQLIGLQFRKASFSHANDPSIEAGDIGVLYDRKNREYPILITRTVFSVGSAQETVCGAETPSRNSATRYESVSKSRVESRKLLNKEQSIREQAIREVNRALAEKSGLYMTVETTTSGDIYYLHDHPNLEESGIVWKMTKDAVGVTTNYDGDDTVWNSGLTVDGTLITQLISTVGLDASWITTGLMSANRIKGGELILGGSNNTNGVLRVYDASGNQIGLWDNSGAQITGDLKLKRKSYTNSTYMIAEIGEAIAGNAANYANIGGGTHYGLHIYDTASNRNGNLYLLASPWSGGTDAGDSLIGSSGRLILYSHLTSSVLNSSWMSFDENGIHMYGGLASSDKYSFGLDNSGFYIGYEEHSTGHARNPIFEVTGTSSLYARVDAFLGSYYGSSFNQTSDIRQKEEIHDIDEAYLKAISNVKFVQFKFKKRDNEQKQFGIIAQDLIEKFRDESITEEYVPIVTSVDEDGEEYFSVNYTQFLVARLAYDEKVIQEQKKQIDEQQAKIEALEDRLAKLEKLVEGML